MIGPFTLPQVVMAGALLMLLVRAMVLHDHPRGGHHSLPKSIVLLGLLALLLGWGGFWTLQ